jgi:hypothetical protein
MGRKSDESDAGVQGIGSAIVDVTPGENRGCNPSAAGRD